MIPQKAYAIISAECRSAGLSVSSGTRPGGPGRRRAARRRHGINEKEFRLPGRPCRPGGRTSFSFGGRIPVNLTKSNLKKLALLIAGGIALNAALQHLDLVRGFFAMILGFLTPFLAGSALAFVINVPMRQIEGRLFPPLAPGKRPGRLRRAKRPISLLLTLLLLFGLLTIVFFLILPEIGRTLHSLVDQIQKSGQDLQVWAESMAEQYPDIVEKVSRITITGEQIMSGLSDFIQNRVGGLVNSTIDIASSIIGGVVSGVVALVFTIYLLMQKERIGRQFRQLLYAYLPEHAADRISDIGTLSFRTFSGFLTGQCLEAVILGCMFFLCMSVLRFPYALAISVLIAVTALIPIFGAFIGCIVGAFLILIVDPILALWFVVLFLVLQQVEGNLIYPHVVGRSVGLPSIWVLVAVTIGGSVMGLAGMLIFIPLCSVAYTLLRENVLQRLHRRRIPEEKLHPPAKLAENTFVEHGKAPVVDIAADQPPEWADRPKAENAPETADTTPEAETAPEDGPHDGAR